ncbi:MAG: efflux RND transporter permease subunit [Planctomycetota bacterium]
MIEFFAKHPTAANLLMILMLAVGLMSLGGLQRETFPDALPTEVQVSVLFPGATPTEVDESIVSRLEEELSRVQFLKEMRSESLSNIGTTTLEMTEDGNYTAFRNEIENAVSSIDDFPDLSEPPIIRRLNTRDSVLDILVETDEVGREPLVGKRSLQSDRNLKAYCESLKDRLMASALVSDVEVGGFSDRVLRVELSRQKLLRYGLSPLDIAAAIGNQNIDLPAGKIESDENTLIRVQEERITARELEQVTITGVRGNAEVRIADLGQVRSEFELEEDRVEVDGKRSAVLTVLKSKSADSLNVAAEVSRLLAIEHERRPGLQFTIINDSSKLVQERISLLVKNGWQGCILVFAVMWLFFNARLSFWVVFSLPVSFLAAFSLVPSVGLTVNMLTMVGLLMAIGLLMDDGIVIAENIARRRQEGEPAMAAAVNGVREVAGGVFSSFLTTCSVLGPLIFLGGDIGRILRVLPMMLLLVLATSLIEAYLILPSHLGHSLEKAGQSRGRIRERIDRWIDAGRDAVGRMVAMTVRWRYLTAGCTAMLFLLSIGLLAGGYVRGQVFPDLEGDVVEARVLMQAGTPLTRTTEVTQRLRESLQNAAERYRDDQPERRELVETTYVRFNLNRDAMETGSHVATLTANLLSNEIRTTRIDDLLLTWKEELGTIPDAQMITFDEPSIGPGGRAIEVELAGLPLEELSRLSRDVQSYLRTYDGVFNVSNDTRKGSRELIVKMRPGAVGLGITTTDLARQLRGSFQGLLSDQVQVGKEGYDIEVRLSKEDRSSVTDLERFLVSLPTGGTVPLSDIATLTWSRSWSRIGRMDGERVLNVVGNADSTRTNTMSVLANLRRDVLDPLEKENPGFKAAYRGQAESGSETGASMLRAAMIGCLGVFVILSYQFRSYIEPLVVMVAIPFAFVGVVWGHFFFGLSISLPSVMGYASLAGIVVNDSILLMLFLKSARKSGTPVEEAASEASRVRFRAVMITSLTTIVGLMPLLLEKSLQAQVLIPIAISICFGLLASTLLVLFVLPALYVILNDWGLTVKGS